MQPTTDIIPSEIEEMLRNGDVMEITERIAEAHGLELQYYGALYRATRGVLLGKLPPSGFMSALESDIGGERDELVRIAQEVNRDIFSPVKAKLKELHGMKEEGARTPLVSATVPTPALATPAPTTAPIDTLRASTEGKEARATFAMPRANADTAPTMKAPSSLETKLGSAFSMKQATADTPVAPPASPVNPIGSMPMAANKIASVPPAKAAPSVTTPGPSSIPSTASPIAQQKTAPSTASPAEKLGLAASVKPAPSTAPAVSIPSSPKPPDPYREAV